MLGTVQSEYTVENKKQVAEFDPSAWIDGDEDEEEEIGTPCPVCGEADQPEILLLCDGCDASYHTHCIGLDRVPNGDWFCMECADSGAYQRAAENASNRPEPVSGRHAPRTQASVNRSARRTRVNAWAGAWGAISRRLHNAAGVEVDFLDFEDDDHMDSFRLYQDRTAAERREFARWQQRISIAQRQGVSANTFRPAAHSRTRPRTPSATIQTAEERQAWGAFERAQSIENRSPRGRKRKSTTSSPVQEQEEPERKLKRPRTRRVVEPGPSQIRRSPPPAVEPSFLSSLLQEVERPTEDARSYSSSIAGPSRVMSPSGYSPPTSPSHTPRATSITPPPRNKHSSSPVPRTSTISPLFPSPEFSPNRSPPAQSPTELRQPRPRRPNVAIPREDVSPVRKSPTTPRSGIASPRRSPTPPQDDSKSPSRRQSQSRRSSTPQTSPATPKSRDSSVGKDQREKRKDFSSNERGRGVLSLETKDAINKIVKTALKPHWNPHGITKEQYSIINRDVSRKLYDIVAESNVYDEKEKHGWEKIATSEVATAIKSLKA